MIKKVLRTGKVEDQDYFRRRDCANMSPDERVNAVLKMQHDFLRWDLNPRIERVGKFKRLDFKDVTENDK